MSAQKISSKKNHLIQTVLLLAACSILLSSCGLFSRTPKPLSQILDKEHTDQLDTKYKVIIPELKEMHTWGNPIDIVTLSNCKVVGNLSVLRKSKTFQFNDEIVIDPVITKDHTFIVTRNGQIKAYSNCDKKLSWSYDLGFKAKNSTSTLMHKNGKLYATIEQYLIVLSCEKGEELFYRKFANKLISGVCVEGQQAYLSDACNLYSIDLESGQVLYKSPGTVESISVESKFQPILYKQNMLLTNHFARQLTFVDPTKMGMPVLQIRHPRSTKSGPISLFVSNLVSQPIIDNNYLYFATRSGVVQKYDIEKNHSNWSLDVPSVQRLAKLGNLLIAVTLSNQAIAINSINGKTVWISNLQLKCKNTCEFLAPLCVNGTLLLLSKTGDLIGLNPYSGQLIFNTDLKLKNAISMSVVNDKLTVFTGKQILENQ